MVIAKKTSHRIFISFHQKTFCSKAAKVILVYYRYAFFKLENERLNEISGSVLPENRLVLQIAMQFAAGSENGSDMSLVTSE